MTKTCKNCGHTHRVGDYFQESCPELGCPCEKFETIEELSKSEKKLVTNFDKASKIVLKEDKELFKRLAKV